jgi:hypothetical protein
VALGGALSLLVGARAATIHSKSWPKSTWLSTREAYPGEGLGHKRWCWLWNIFQEFLQNFVGSFAGWCCVGALAVRVSKYPELQGLNGGDAFLFLAAILGTSGRLAETVHRFIDAIGKIVEGVVKKLS